MSKLVYNSQNQLEFAGVRLSSLVRDEQDPTYVYSRNCLAERVFQFQSILAKNLLYQAFHRIFPLQRSSEINPAEKWVADVVGPICESSDFLGRDRVFAGLNEGDWLCVGEAGAYGASMASGYNAFPLPREIWI